MNVRLEEVLKQQLNHLLGVKRVCSKKLRSDFQLIIRTKWKQNLFFPPTVPSAILSEFLWFNSNIPIDKKTAYFHKFSEKNVNFVGQLFQNGKLKKWNSLQQELNLQDSQKFAWLQITYAIRNEWKKQFLII